MEKLKLKTSYYDKFVCTGSDCPSTCCTGWKIRIDNKTYEKYKNIKDEKIRKYILENITDTKTINLKKNYCPFVDENQLCFIQKNYGHDMLCDVCKKFPRDTQSYEDLIFDDVLISCPEVINLIKKEKLFNETSNLEELDKNKLSVSTKLYLTLRNKIKLIYDSNLSLQKSMFLLLNLNKDIKPFFEKEITEESVNKIDSLFNENYFKLKVKNFKRKKNYDFIKEYLKYLLPKIKVKTGIIEIEALFNNFEKEDFNSINFKYLFKTALKGANKALNLKNLLFFLLNNSLVEIVSDEDFSIHCLYALLFLLVTVSFSMVSILNEGNFLNNDYLRVTSYLFRYLYHSQKIRKIIAEEIILETFNEDILIKLFSSF